jgi:hypothetical protein
MTKKKELIVVYFTSVWVARLYGVEIVNEEYQAWGSGRGPFPGTVPLAAWKDWVKPWKISIRTVEIRAADAQMNGRSSAARGEWNQETQGAAGARSVYQPYARPRNRVLFPGGERYFFFLYSIRTGTEGHTTSYVIRTKRHFSRGQGIRAWSWPLISI